MPKGFSLEKTWRASGEGSTTFNAPGNVAIPYGKEFVTITGSGSPAGPTSGGTYASTNPSTGGTSTGTYNPASGGNYASTNPSTPGNSATGYSPGNPTGVYNVLGYNYANGDTNASYTQYSSSCPPSNYYVAPPGGTPGTAYSCGAQTNPGSAYYYYNPSTPGNPNYNPVVPSSVNYNPVVTGNSNYNPVVPGNPGSPAYALGVTAPYNPTPSSNPATTPTVVGQVVNPYNYPDNNTYPVTVPTGGYIIVTVN